MSYRKVVLANDEVYHIINRGVSESEIFIDKRDYSRFLETFIYYQKVNPPVRFSFRKRVDKRRFSNLDDLVEIICYCLMPNHFHFLLKQMKDDGISVFISKLTNSFTRYFNTRHRRKGHLFQGPFQAVRIETDEQLKHVSRYIHLNPAVSYLVERPQDYPFSSYREFCSGKKGICQKELVLDLFSSSRDYEKFVLNHKDYARRLEEIKKLILD